MQPFISFSCLIAMCIVDSPNKRCTLNEIYEWIKVVFCLLRIFV
jgi:hypothetical protein